MKEKTLFGKSACQITGEVIPEKGRLHWYHEDKCFSFEQFGDRIVLKTSEECLEVYF